MLPGDLRSRRFLFHFKTLLNHLVIAKLLQPTAWFSDCTPGLYSSAVEVRTQDCDSDDESDSVNSRVSILDAQFNVQHICLVLDALGHCAKFIGDTFDRYIFRSLHKVLLKLGR